MMTNDFSNSICHRLLEREKTNADAVYLRQPKSAQWHEYTWAEVMDQARRIAHFLQNIGLKKGDKVSIFSKNCAEWFIADFAITLAGLINVPLFSNQHESSIQYVLEHAEVKVVFLGKLDHFETVRSYIPEHLPTISFDYHSSLSAQFTWKEVLKTEPLTEVVIPNRHDLYTIIYSSGTSGTPRGAMFTHEAIANYLEIFPEDIKRVSAQSHYHLLSYLPLAHVYERSAIQLTSLVIPCDVSFVESLDSFGHNLQEVSPTLFAAVPRIWDVFRHKINQKIPAALLVFLLKVPGVSRFLKKKIQKQLGLERSSGNFSGAAHLPVNLIDFFEKLDVIIQEGYGQTENFAYATLSLKDRLKKGFVGSARLQVDLKLDDNNELLMKGPCLMSGYYKNEEATLAAFNEEGWLRTGDIVEMDAEKRIKILGRVSENFKNQKGEFIAPTPIEKRFGTKKGIEYLCLVGRELPSNVLLVSLTSSAQSTGKEEMTAYLEKQLHLTNQGLKSYEKISHILVVKELWAPENNLLTPTLKVKRRVVEEHYHDFIQRAVEEHSKVVWE